MSWGLIQGFIEDLTPFKNTLKFELALNYGQLVLGLRRVYIISFNLHNLELLQLILNFLLLRLFT